ncbi:MAG: BolA family transcriptional regulator [Pseudorhodobacter sp.]|nr:BolA family transcriptional regulator [Rhizobacter sp.]
MTITAEQIDQILRATLLPIVLEVHDDSHLHAGHAGAKEGRHFSVRVISERFAGLNRVARHRLVYDALKAQLKGASAGSIHALAIEARTPHEP